MSKQGDIEAAREHLEELRRVLIDRYGFSEPYDSPLVGAVDAAIAAGAAADVAGLRALLEGQNLYARHAALAEASIYGVETAFAVAPPTEVAKVKPIARQSKAELIATAAAHGVEVPDGATADQLREALAPTGFQVIDQEEFEMPEPEPIEEPTPEPIVEIKVELPPEPPEEPTEDDE